ncbi:MAG: ABC transporter ATP-binding protein [Candidatus Omnitrophota bacterium]
MKKYLRLISYVKGHIGILVFAAFFMMLSSLLQPVSFSVLIPFIDRVLVGKKLVIAVDSLPQFVVNLVEKVNGIERLELLGYCLIFGIVLFVLRFVFTYFQQYFMREVSQRVVRDMRNIIYEKLLGLSLNFYSTSQTGTLVSRITYDTTIIQDAVAEGLTDLVLESCTFLFTLIMIVSVARAFNINIIFILIVLFVMPLIAFPLLKIGKKLRQISKKSQESMAGINNILFETISGIRIVKAFSMQDYEIAKFKEQNSTFKKAVMKSNKRILAVSPISEFATLVVVMLIIWFVGREVIMGNMTVGALTAFLALILTLSKPIKRLSRVHTVNQQALSAATRIFDILDTEVDIKEASEAVKVDDIKSGVDFSSVSFAYEDKMVLKDISFNVKAGEIIAFVGPSGAGKTTLVNLIPRFYDPTKGVVSLDGVDLKKIKIKALRNLIGIVTQETVLFNDTVWANIAYGRKDVDMKEIIAAAKTANAHNYIIKLPKGYDTVIGERGFRLSGGEKQRLAIARAVFKNPPILMFDEATSQLDSESEKLVQQAIDRLMEGRTVFVIAHRLSTIKHADKIIVINNGEIVDMGTHDNLLKNDGLYKKLYNMQFTGI